MEVLLWQIGVFLTIVITGFFGKSARIGITAFAVLFTIVMVFTSGLMILQFFTIGLAYWVSDFFKGKPTLEHRYSALYNPIEYELEKRDFQKQQDNKESLLDKTLNGCGCIIIIFMATCIGFAIYTSFK